MELRRGFAGVLFAGMVILAGTDLQGWGQAVVNSPGEAMAKMVMEEWPGGVISTTGHPGAWGYEEGVLLDGMAAEWHATANGREFAYIKEAVDRYVKADGTIAGFGAEGHSLDEIEMGRAVLLCYRVTQQPKYYKAARFIHEQLEVQPRNASGGYWHKERYPNQMWLDSAYMAEPFRAEYAATFQSAGEFADVAKQLLLMDAKMRDARTGLLRHGWDESKQMAWADRQTGLSPEVWSRADGWYAMAIEDVLDWMPDGAEQRTELVEALKKTMTGVVRYQDAGTGLWWQVMDRGGRAGNYPEASASCMFVYALAKGVRLGYLPQTYEAAARRGWEGIGKTFVKNDAEGRPELTRTVKGAGLGGTPYRSGSYEYYVGEKVIDNDAKGVGAYLKAANEMAQAGTEAEGQGKTVLLDAWFNSQTRKNAAGQTELFHYKWDDDANSGFSFFGRAFERYGVKLREERIAPTAEDLAKVQIYILASPDIPSKNPAPHYMDAASAKTIERWVRQGGVLLMMENDVNNSEFEHFNLLSERFGMHFNPVLRNTVEGNHFEQGRVDIPSGTGVFAESHVAYMKEICTIALSGPARAIVADKGDVLMAVARVGRGAVYAVVDPWLYNEYTDGRKLPAEYDTFAAAVDLAGWAVRTSGRTPAASAAPGRSSRERSVSR